MKNTSNKKQGLVADYGLMLGVAISIDVMQALLALVAVGLIINRIITVFAWLTFYVWFKIKGVSFMKPKRFFSLNGAGLAESIPLIGALPLWTASVLLLIGTTKAGERQSYGQQNI